MGVTRIFESENADLSGLFVKKSPELISEAHQKLFLDVNEAGCGTKTVFRNRKMIFDFLTVHKIFFTMIYFVIFQELLGC